MQTNANRKGGGSSRISSTRTPEQAALNEANAEVKAAHKVIINLQMTEIRDGQWVSAALECFSPRACPAVPDRHGGSASADLRVRSSVSPPSAN